MKTFLLPACLAACAAGLLGGCGHQPAPAGPALSAPATGAPATASPGPAAALGPDASSGTPSVAPEALPPGMPTPMPTTPGSPKEATPEQQRVLSGILNDMATQAARAQVEHAQAYAKEMAAWQAKQAEAMAAYDKQVAAAKADKKEWEAAQKSHEEKLANPQLSKDERAQLMAQTLQPVPLPQSLPPPPSFQSMEPTPFRGDFKANTDFDSLIYAFRQAKSANDYAKAAAVATQMKTLCAQVSPDLVNAYLREAATDPASFPQISPSAHPPAAP